MATKNTERSLYAKDDLQQIASFLIKSKATLSVAESVTAGCLQTALSLAEGATMFFQGGVTVYQGGQKTKILNVEPIYGEHNEFVNSQVACQMALGANELFLSKYAIAITGFAQPIPGHKFINPYAYYAIAEYEKVILRDVVEVMKADSFHVQVNFAQQVLKIFKDYLYDY